MTRGVMAGVVAGLLVAAAILGIVWYAGQVGLIELPVAHSEHQRLVLILESPDSGGAGVAALVFVVDLETGTISPLNPYEESTVSGTSARNAREALPYGGGDAVRDAVTLQTGTSDMEWVSVSAGGWAAMVDDCGPIGLRMGRSVSSYVNGTLEIFSEGAITVDGTRAVALAGALADLPETDRDGVYRQLSAGVGTCLLKSGTELRDLVREGRATSSLPAAKVPVLGQSR